MITIEKAVNAESFVRLINALDLTPPVLIKPNWGTVACFTEAQILDWTLAAIPGEKMVIESHGWARNEETLLGNESLALTKANLRKGERWFLKYAGLDEVLQKHGAKYLNLTEEVWAGRVASTEEVQQAVEQRFAPVQFPELYAKVPARLFALRGGTLLSQFELVFSADNHPDFGAVQILGKDSAKHVSVL